jgi:hypothetical protein
MKKLFIMFLVFVISILSATAQVEMADKLREDGKIYAVLAVILIMFAGIITYMFVLDRKISKLEDKK